MLVDSRGMFWSEAGVFGAPAVVRFSPASRQAMPGRSQPSRRACRSAIRGHRSPTGRDAVLKIGDPRLCLTR